MYVRACWCVGWSFESQSSNFAANIQEFYFPMSSLQVEKIRRIFVFNQFNCVNRCKKNSSTYLHQKNFKRCCCIHFKGT